MRLLAAVASHIAAPPPRPRHDLRIGDGDGDAVFRSDQLRTVLLEKHGHRLLLNIAELADHVRARPAQVAAVTARCYPQYSRPGIICSTHGRKLTAVSAGGDLSQSVQCQWPRA